MRRGYANRRRTTDRPASATYGTERARPVPDTHRDRDSTGMLVTLVDHKRQRTMSVLERKPPKDRNQQPFRPPPECIDTREQSYDQQRHAEQHGVHELRKCGSDKTRKPVAERVASAVAKCWRQHRYRSQ
jgi:hypothetical protein